MTVQNKGRLKFSLGQIVVTQGVSHFQAENGVFARFVVNSLVKHAHCDWGNVPGEDKQENEFSLKEGFRLLSAYEQEGLPRIWIITEADRSATTILFPNEY